MKRIKYIISLALLLLLLSACETKEKKEQKEISTPVEEMQYQQEVIENARESDRQLEEQLEAIPVEY